MNGKGQGWRNESHRHKLAGMGIKTGSMGASGRIDTVRTEVFKFDELSTEAQQKAIEKQYDINVRDFEWWDSDGLLDLSSDEMKRLKIKLSKEWWKSDKPKDDRGNIIGEYPAYTGLIKYDIGEFDIDRRQYVQFENIEIIDEDIFRKLLGIPVKTWKKVDYWFSNPQGEYNTEIGFEAHEDLTLREEEIMQKASDIWDDKVHDAYVSLNKEYEYRTGERSNNRNNQIK